MSHAVVAIPIARLSKGRIPAIAVIVGSVSPDFPYLLVLTPTHAPGHSLWGIPLYCIVPSLAVLFVWYRWLENPTLAFWKLPERIQSTKIPSIPLVILGIILGASSHVLWDSTSHSYGIVVQSNLFWSTELYSIPIYKWNQYLSGVLGLVLLGLWYLHALIKNSEAPYTGRFKGGVIIYAISIMVLVSAGNFIHQSTSIADIVVTTSIGVMSGGVVAAVVYSAIYRAQHNV